MKRLKKKAEVNLDLFLTSHLNYNQNFKDEIEEIVKSNADCIYNGGAYRGLLFSFDEIKDAHDQFLIEVNETKVDYSHLHYYINNILDKVIRVNRSYQSFSKTFQGAMNSLDFKGEEGYINIIIKCDINNGLDIEKLVNKYRDILRRETLESFDNFANQDEVLAKFEDRNFFVPEAGNLRQIFKKIEGE